LCEERPYFKLKFYPVCDARSGSKRSHWSKAIFRMPKDTEKNSSIKARKIE
jgi:hypothetical protein